MRISDKWIWAFMWLYIGSLGLGMQYYLSIHKLQDTIGRKYKDTSAILILSSDYPSPRLSLLI